MIKKISMIALVLLLVGVVGSAFTFKSIFAAKEPIEEVVPITKDFNAIEIDSEVARVEVVPADISEAQIELTGGTSDYKLDAGVEGSTLKIKVGNKRMKLFSFGFRAALNLKVSVPEKEYAALQIESNNGRVRIKGLTANDIFTKTDNGRIMMQDVNGTSITTKASNGKIQMKGITAKDIEVFTDNGSVELDDVMGVLKAETNNGSIALHTETLDRDIDFATDNGRINIQTDKKPTNTVLDIKTSNGRMEVFGNSNWDTIIGDGEYLVKLTTHNGRVTVE